MKYTDRVQQERFEVTMFKIIDPKKIKNLLRFREYEPKADIGYYIYQGELRWDAENRIVFIPAWLV